MAEKPVKEIRWLTIFLCTIFFCLPLFLFGLHYAGLYFWTRTSDDYYLDFPYFQFACLFLTATFISLGAILYRACRNGPAILLVVPILFFVPGTILFPDLQPNQLSDRKYVSKVGGEIDRWSHEHKRYPKTETEMQEALKPRPLEAEPIDVPESAAIAVSQYRRAGQVVPYQVKVEIAARGPRLNADAPPGVVYYAVSSDFQECWLTMSALGNSFGNGPDEPLSLLGSKGNPYVIHKALRDGWSHSQQEINF